MTDLSNNDKIPFGEMKWNVYMSMFSAYMRGDQIQYWSTEYPGWYNCNPSWTKTIIYRVKPETEAVTLNHLGHTPRYIGRSSARYCH